MLSPGGQGHNRNRERERPAAARGLRLVTDNTAEFRAFKGLKVQSWARVSNLGHPRLPGTER